MRFPKAPDRCPHCNSLRITKKGKRAKKLETIQQFRCQSCGRTFGTGSRMLRNKTYPQREILDAITTYNLGYTLCQTVDKLSARHGHAIPKSTIANWINLYPAVTTYRRLRVRSRRLFPPVRTVRAHKLYHRQVYEFACHRPKLALLRTGQLDDKRADDVRFSVLADFLDTVAERCPHELFRSEDGSRGSQIEPTFIDFDRLIVKQKQNAATDMARLVLPTVGSNYERHPVLQRFMLANDSVTLAVEVPIWLTAAGIAAVEQQHQIKLVADHGSGSLTGHIDFLQVRNGAIHILDYKPDARTNKPIAQLTVYALALTRLVPGLKLFDIKCAWFNENEYCEFFPRTVLKHSPPQ